MVDQLNSAGIVPSVEDAIAEEASWVEAAKPLRQRDRYFEAVRQNEAAGNTVPRLDVALAALDCGRLGPNAQAMLAVLLRLMGYGWSVSPPIQDLASAAGLSDVGAKRALSELEKENFLIRTRMAFNGKGRAFAHYTMAPAVRMKAMDRSMFIGSIVDRPARYVSHAHAEGHEVVSTEVACKRTSAFERALAEGHEVMPLSQSDGHEIVPLRDADDEMTGTTSCPSENAAYIENARAPAHLDKLRPISGEVLAPVAMADAFPRDDEPCRWDEARGRLLVRYPTGKPLTITQATISAAAAASGFPGQHVLAHVEAIAAGWATPQDWRKAEDGTYRPDNVLAGLTRDLVRARSTLLRAAAEGKAAEASARATVMALPGSGVVRRYSGRLDTQLVCPAGLPITRGTANAILDDADRLRSKDPIACVVDFEAVLGQFERGQTPTHSQIATAVALAAVRRVYGIGDLWLADAAAIAAELKTAWPHVPPRLIEQQVLGIESDPAFAGVNVLDWDDETEAEVRALIIKTARGVVAAVAKLKRFKPIASDIWTVLEGDDAGTPCDLRHALQRINPDDRWIWETSRRILAALAPIGPRMHERWGKADIASEFREALQNACVAATGRSDVDLSGVSIEVGCPVLEQPIRLAGKRPPPLDLPPPARMKHF